jgi:DNA-binding GntR family transcriptional regulator
MFNRVPDCCRKSRNVCVKIILNGRQRAMTAHAGDERPGARPGASGWERDGNVPAGLADRVYTHVKASILLGRARPGDVLAAHALAQTLSVSRTPVHEALKRLVSEGYLVSQPRVGYAVTPIDLGELRDLFQVRTRLEALSAELAAKTWTDEDMSAFRAADRQAQRRHRELRRADEPIELAQFLHNEHKRFHSMIANLGGNRRLERLISDLQDETQRYWALLPDDQLVGRVFLADEAHAAILTAIATQDPAKARAAVVTHLRDGVQLMLDAVVPEYPPPEDLGA